MWNTIDRNNYFLKTFFAIFKILFILSEGLRDCSSYIDINYKVYGPSSNWLSCLYATFYTKTRCLFNLVTSVITHVPILSV